MNSYLVAVQIDQGESGYGKTLLVFAADPDAAKRTVEQVADSADDLTGTLTVLGVMEVEEADL